MRDVVENGLKVLKPGIKKIIPPAVIQTAKTWMIKNIQHRMRTDPILPFEKGAFPDGINLIGPVDAATGLGQSFRLVERVIRELGIPYVIYPFADAEYHKVDIKQYEDKISQELIYSVNLWHVSPLEFAALYTTLGKAAFDRHYNIAYWLWELENFPDEWVGYEQVLDEIWTPSEFITRTLMKKIKKPVYTIPYWVTAETNVEKYNRTWFHLPGNRFLFLMMYDGNSVSERKNPDGAIKAFQMAFTPDQKDVALVIKAGSLSRDAYHTLKEKLSGYRNIRIIRGTLEKTEVNSLIACADALISLHRAEGFGLVLAEAMLNQVPVIATDWSANTEFMNDSCGCMVPYRMVQLDHSIPPYKKGERWAEPDLEEAASYMKRLKEEPVWRNRIREEAFLYVKEKLGKDSVCERVRSRLARIAAL